MLQHATPVDDRIVGSPDRSGAAAPPPRPADWKAVEEVLGLLARAVQQFHTYPAASPLCVAAIEACHRGVAALGARDALAFRITPSAVIVDEAPTGAGTAVERELARRLHRASVASVAIERAVSVRELARFCEDLAACGEHRAGAPTLLDMVAEHGVERVIVEMASRPEVLDVRPVGDDTAAAMARGRARVDAQVARGGVLNHLYPPQKGWVRLDPAAAPPRVSLPDLALLAGDPGALAAMLLRLTGDGDEVPPGEALPRKYGDVAMLIGALEPPLARRMFGSLARAVLDLEPGARQALLRRAVLPGLLDNRPDGAILRDFPDVDLAESLCLLLDLETAAPELLATALARLDLPAERHAAVLPLIEAELRAREEGAAEDGARQTVLARHARELMRVDGGAGKCFAEFAAFDLAVDPAATAALEEMRAAMPRMDVIADQLACLWHLACLEPNPDAVGRFLERSFRLLAGLEAAGRCGELAPWLSAYRGLAERLREPRPDVAGAIAAALAAYCTVERAAWIVRLAEQGAAGREAAGAMIAALGGAVAAPLAALLERDPSEGKGDRAPDTARAVAQLLVEHAAALGPAVAPLLAHSTPGVARTLLRVLGAAGPGSEHVIADYVGHGEEQTAREALRALARLGTARAAGLVVGEILKQRGPVSVAAEETLWHFPPAEAQRHTRDLIGRRDFARSHPRATERLLDRAVRRGAADLAPALLALAPLRFRIWNPALARLARKAHRLLRAGAVAAVASTHLSA